MNTAALSPVRDNITFRKRLIPKLPKGIGVHGLIPKQPLKSPLNTSQEY